VCVLRFMYCRDDASDACYYACTLQRGDEYFPGYIRGIVYRSALPIPASECS
jgi:hypothetical protein